MKAQKPSGVAVRKTSTNTNNNNNNNNTDNKQNIIKQNSNESNSRSSPESSSDGTSSNSLTNSGKNITNLAGKQAPPPPQQAAQNQHQQQLQNSTLISYNNTNKHRGGHNHGHFQQQHGNYKQHQQQHYYNNGGRGKPRNRSVTVGYFQKQHMKNHPGRNNKQQHNINIVAATATTGRRRTASERGVVPQSHPLGSPQSYELSAPDYNYLQHQQQHQLTRQCACPMLNQCQQHNSSIDIKNGRDFLALKCTGAVSNGDNATKSGNQCTEPQLIHRSCLQILETHLVDILKRSTYTCGFSDKDRRAQLWGCFNRWKESCKEFSNALRCRKCSGGVLKFDDKFDVDAFIQLNTIQARQSTGTPTSSHSAHSRSLLPTPKNNNGSDDKNLPQGKIVHRPEKLPKVWSVKKIGGELSGILKEFNISEPWLNPDFDTTTINAIESEKSWHLAKNRYQKRLNGQISSDSKSPSPNLHLQEMEHTSYPARSDFDDLIDIVPIHKLNPFSIMMEAGGQSFGVDDLRTYILSNLSQCHCDSLNCCLCKQPMAIYQHFPLVAGTMFLSHEKSRNSGSKVQLQHGGQNLYLHGVCSKCLCDYGRKVACAYCKKHWSGESWQIGTLNKFDIFACAPCCQSRIECKDCHKPVLKKLNQLKYFSQYSEKITCPHCGTTDYHLVRSTDTYVVIPDNKYRQQPPVLLPSRYQQNKERTTKERQRNSSSFSKIFEEDHTVTTWFNATDAGKGETVATVAGAAAAAVNTKLDSTSSDTFFLPPGII